MQGWWPHLLGHRRWRAGAIPIAVVLKSRRNIKFWQIFYRSFLYIKTSGKYLKSSCKFSIDHFNIYFHNFQIFSPAFSTNLSVFSCLLGPWDCEIYESMEHHGPLWSTDKQMSPKLIQKTDPVMWSSSFFHVFSGRHHVRCALWTRAPWIAPWASQSQRRRSFAAVAASLGASLASRFARTGPSGALAPPPVGQAGEKLFIFNRCIIKY